MKTDPSLFDRWIARPRHRWPSLVVALVLILAPFVTAWLEGSLGWLSETGRWRDVLVAPTVVLYILVVAPFQAAMDARAVASLRPLLTTEDVSLDRLAEEASQLTRAKELAAFGVGLVVALAFSAQGLAIDFTWLELVLFVEAALEYGLLAVVIYGSLASTRVTRALLRLPLRIDPLDVTPFEAIGLQSLMLALIFVGGVTLSLLFLGVHPEVFLQWQLYVIYAPLIIVPVLVFFLNMAPTHHRLRAARDSELGRVQHLIRRECSEMVQRMEQGDEPAASAQRVSALAAYESRLLQARTWPYNTTMLRTVFVSVLIPGGTMIGRLLVEFLKR
jgi:hypothetical protein